MTNNLNLSRDEYCFIDILFRQLESQQKRYINIDRKSDKTLNFCYKDIQVGRIKLQGKKPICRYYSQTLIKFHGLKAHTGTTLKPRNIGWPIYGI